MRTFPECRKSNEKTQVCCAVCVIPCLCRNLEYSWGIHLIWCIRCYQIMSCFVVLICPRATRAAKMNKRSWELWWRILRRRRTLMTFACWCFCTYHCVGLRWYHDAVEHTRISHAVDGFILMLTSADCMIQTTRCSFINRIVFETKCFLFFYIPRLLETVRDILRPRDFRCWCREHGLNRPWTVQVCPVRVLGGTDNVYGKAWGRDCNPRRCCFFCCVFLELECKINEPWTLWLAACS